jgi:hypothetical protein
MLFLFAKKHLPAAASVWLHIFAAKYLQAKFYHPPLHLSSLQKPGFICIWLAGAYLTPDPSPA